MNMDKFVVRAAELTGAYGNYKTAPELVDMETVALARCTLVNQEMELFIRFCYKRADNGRFVHLRANSMIPRGVWSPWGSSGKSNLTRTERDTLRRYLLSLNTPRPPKPLFFYLDANRRWFVDTVRYGTVEEALQWLERYKLTPALWLEYSLWPE